LNNAVALEPGASGDPAMRTVDLPVVRPPWTRRVAGTLREVQALELRGALTIVGLTAESCRGIAEDAYARGPETHPRRVAVRDADEGVGKAAIAYSRRDVSHANTGTHQRIMARCNKGCSSGGSRPRSPFWRRSQCLCSA
jgi:hypothetical protein